MKLLRAYRTELDPNREQRALFVKHAGAARFVYNWALSDRIERYKAGESTNLYAQKRRFNALKGEAFPWLAEVSYRAVEQAFTNLDRAYANFFRRVKAKDKDPGFPRFKSRKRGLGAFTLRQGIHVEERRIKLPRIGWVRLKERGYLPCAGVRVLSANVSERAGRWFVSLQVEAERPQPAAATGPAIGVDLGVKVLATLSNGRVFENPRSLAKYERRLKHLSRELCRRQKGSRNRDKTRRKLARLHARIADVRANALHQVSHYLTAKTKPSAVAIEDLNVKGMLANRHLSKAIADASFAELRRQLEYKAAWYGVDLVLAGRFYPSSKTCSGCGSVKPLLRLSERTFVCEACGLLVDRDLNAARNLASLTARRAECACGGERSGLWARCSPAKQEPV